MSDHTLLKETLELKLRELLERASEIENVLSDPGDSDWEENALETENDESLAVIGDVTKREIEDIKLALSRIEAGLYGICTHCGTPIEKERLVAIPYTRFCIRCA
jgi:DnaK suppressor protein